MSENPNQVHGRLMESAHISGYTFERVCSELEWLLEEDRWKQVGPGYDDINEFLETVDLSPFNMKAGKRKDLVKRLDELQASRPATGKALGVSERTVYRDLDDETLTSVSPVRGKGADDLREQDSNISETVTDVSPVEVVTAVPQDEPAWFQRDDVADQARTAEQRRRKEAEKQQQRERNREAVETGSALETPSGRFATVVFDPPWSWSDEGDVSQLGRARPNYHTMTFDEIAAQSIGDYAEDDAHIYLWITNRSLPKGPALLEAWGFRYVTTLTWCKPSFGMGNYFRGSTEHVLFGVKGSLPLLRSDVGTWFTGERGDEHSAKPEQFYRLVEQCSPAPWVDILGRQERPGWQTIQAIEVAA